MRPTDQTRLYDPENRTPPGNCFAAAVATVLEIPLEQVPDEARDWRPGMPHHQSWRKYWPRFINWLQCGHGLSFVDVHVGELLPLDPEELIEVTFIASGPSPRDPEILHAVVGTFERTAGGCAFRVLHDPHPSRAGLEGNEIKWVGLFVRR